jgi:hypothetical protein
MHGVLLFVAALLALAQGRDDKATKKMSVLRQALHQRRREKSLFPKLSRNQRNETAAGVVPTTTGR